MAEINEIVKVIINLTKPAATVNAFGDLLIMLDPQDGATEASVLVFANAASVGEEYGTNSPAYISAVQVFSQTPCVNKITIASGVDGDTLLAAYNRIVNISDDFYAVSLITEKTDQGDSGIDEMMDLAQAIQADGRKVMIISLVGDDVKSDSDTDIQSLMLANGIGRVTAFPHLSTKTAHQSSALLGRMLAYRVGAATWAFKSLVNVPDDASLTLAERQILNQKNAIYYNDFRGSPVTFNGTFADGTFIDSVVGVDFMRYEIENDMAQLLKDAPVLSYTDAGGIALIRNALQGCLSRFTSDGIILDNYTIVMPKRKDATVQNIANRILAPITFTAQGTSAIHSITINGSISY